MNKFVLFKKYLVREILRAFPNYERLGFSDAFIVGQYDDHCWLLDRKYLSSFSFSYRGFDKDTIPMEYKLQRYLPPSVVTIGRLQLRQITCQTNPIYSFLITRFAHCLNTLKLNLVNLAPSIFSLPILPKLRSLTVFGLPEFEFKSQADRFSLNFAQQFPQLEKLRIVQHPETLFVGILCDVDFF